VIALGGCADNGIRRNHRRLTAQDEHPRAPQRRRIRRRRDADPGSVEQDRLRTAESGTTMVKRSTRCR
jgi:hypothetical protein